jgi:hypothetical protein
MRSRIGSKSRGRNRAVPEIDRDTKVDRELLAGPAWGWMIGDQFRALPKMPLILAGFRTPPFDVQMPSGDIRRVVQEPNT